MSHSHPNIDIADDERLAGRIALNIHERPKSVKHCNNTILDDYFAGRITKKDENTFFEYLEANPDAYREWTERARTSTIKSRKARLPLLSESISTFIRKLTELPTSRLAYAGVACAALVFVVLVSLPNGAPNTITTNIDNGFAQLKHLNPSGSIGNILMPWEIHTSEQAFSPRTKSSTRAIAFANGLAQGKYALTKPQKTMKRDGILFNAQLEMRDDLVIYQDLGRWNILVWAACDNQNDVPTDFWIQQFETARHLLEELPSQEHPLFSNHLNTSLQLLSQITKAENKDGLVHKLKDELEQFRLLFSARELPKV